jgi:hypothetical protein
VRRTPPQIIAKIDAVMKDTSTCAGTSKPRQFKPETTPKSNRKNKRNWSSKRQKSEETVLKILLDNLEV